MYEKTLRVLIAPVLILTGLRAALKVLAIDPVTGFYEGPPLPGSIFLVLMLLCAAVIAVGIRRAQDPGMKSVHGSRFLEGSAALLGGALLAVSAVRLFAVVKTGFAGGEVNVLPAWLRAIEHLLGLACGALLFWLAATWVSGADRSEKTGVASLLLVLWQALYLVDRFISFRQVSTVSDQLMETLFLLSALLFWLAHARCIADSAPSRKRVLLFALLAVLLGLPLAVGQTAALLVFGSCSGPAVGDIVLIFCCCFYFAAFAFAVLCARDAEAGESD